MRRLLLHPLRFLFLAPLLCAAPVHAQPLMSLYRASAEYFPSVRSYQFREQALRSEYTGLGLQRFLDMDLAANYSHFSTADLGKYPGAELGLVNTFDLFNKRGIDRAIIRAGISRNRSLTDAERKTLFTRVTEAYYTLLKYTLLLQIHRESLDLIEQTVLLANAGVEKGAFPASETARWTIEKLTRRNALMADSLEIARAEDTLRSLTGLTSFAPSDTTGDGSGGAALEDLLAHSPELAVFDADKRQAELEIQREFRGMLPDLSVSNSLVKNREPGSTGDYYLVSAGLAFKLFDGGRKHRVDAIKARIRSIESDRAAAVAILSTEYGGQLRELQTRREMLANLETARRLSMENLSNLAAGYRKRFIDFTTFYTAFRDEVNLREDYANTFADFNRSVHYLIHLSSGDIYP